MSQNNQPIMPKKKKKKKWPWILLVLVVAVAVVLFYSAGKQVSASFSEDTVRARDIVTYYSFSGNLTPVDDHTQTAKDSIKIKELYVAEGDTVTQGDALLRGADGTRIFAAYTGTIEELYPETDDQLQAGSQIARIVDYTTMEVSIDVDEYDIDAVSVGKEGDVYINALARNITGRVSEVARNATTDGGVSYYEVTMEIETLDDVRSGMSVEVQMLNKQELGALSLSLDSISYDEYNKPFVYQKDADENMSAVYVETGVSDSQNIQITSGLTEGATVYYQANDMARFYMMQNMMTNSRSN
ncbi:MAG: HlyD family efflux transporter periplasmic adaptor subunit [Clostridiales bacterium]|nr:HlyD family efflux transporter periplasmic adaptor subunit [Clostridiales bacterium]